MAFSKIPMAETLLTGVSIWWAIVLIVNQTYLDSVMPEHMERFTGSHDLFWAGVFIAAALTKIIGLLTMKGWVRKIGLIMSMILYSLICSGYFLSGAYFSTGTGVYFLFTVAAWFGFREVSEYEQQ